MKIPRLVIAGTHSGVGKTTVTLSLLAALRKLGRIVQPFKIGPDFIDPGHHDLACGRESRNLDGWMLGPVVNRRILQEAAHGADLSVIEGMMGLFDGASSKNDNGSTAAMAKQLNTPVILVVDGSGMAGSAAALVHGYASFDAAVNLAGVIFNRVGSPRHFHLLKDVVESKTQVPVLGYFPPDPGFEIADRHLGLRMAREDSDSKLYRKLGEAALGTLDLAAIEQIAHASESWDTAILAASPKEGKNRTDPVRIGVGYDPAFCFYYQDNLNLLEAAGGHCTRFSPMEDSCLPEVDVLYFGGGYPELYASVLAENSTMRQSIREFARKGGIIYAECGGLMYLARSLRNFEGDHYDMVGLFPLDVVMGRTTMTIGYRELRLQQDSFLGEEGLRVRGHEFHYSKIENEGDIMRIGELRDAQGNYSGSDGFMVGNVIALYTHLHFASHPQIPASLVGAGFHWREERGVLN